MVPGWFKEVVRYSADLKSHESQGTNVSSTGTCPKPAESVHSQRDLLTFEIEIPT
jgi:hypothetical protein